MKWTYAEYMADIRTAAKAFIKVGEVVVNLVYCVTSGSQKWYRHLGEVALFVPFGVLIIC